MNYEIEKGIQFSTCRPTKYPWNVLGVDESFFVPFGTSQNFHSYVWHANKRYAPKLFKCSKAEKDGVLGSRVWRVA